MPRIVKEAISTSVNRLEGESGSGLPCHLTQEGCSRQHAAGYQSQEQSRMSHDSDLPAGVAWVKIASLILIEVTGQILQSAVAGYGDDPMP